MLVPSVCNAATLTPSLYHYSDPPQCPVCGHRDFSETKILWPELVSTWELNPDEETFINRQQGFHCTRCHTNLRSMTLAAVINEYFDWHGTLEALPTHPAAAAIQLLEINEAGSLHPFLSRFPHAVFAAYPETDMQQMPYPDNSFDLVIHSDTLEHLMDPVQGLRECRRIVKPGGCMVMTVPVLPSRLTRRRFDMPASYHGNCSDDTNDLIVWSEYGADFFLDMLAAGWHQTTLFTLTGPESIAIVGTKPQRAPEAKNA
ncbi:methyltransferase domain-containing protein [bacterium]|nr:methyltransferase domain-containing protein [bacterium]